MAGELRLYRCWEGGCFERIYDALFRLIQSAESDVNIDRCAPKGCGSPNWSWHDKGESLRDAAFDLLRELVEPSTTRARFPRSALYQLGRETHQDVAEALDTLVDDFERMMRRWGWIVDDPERLQRGYVFWLLGEEVEALQLGMGRLDQVYGLAASIPTPPWRYPERSNFPPPPPRKGATPTGDDTERAVSADVEHEVAEQNLMEAAGQSIDEPPRNPANRPQGRGSDGRNPGSKALSAAYELLDEKKQVTFRAACSRAGVDRNNVRKKYPSIFNIINQMNNAENAPRRGVWDNRAEDFDAVDEEDE